MMTRSFRAPLITLVSRSMSSAVSDRGQFSVQSMTAKISLVIYPRVVMRGLVNSARKLAKMSDLDTGPIRNTKCTPHHLYCYS